MMGIDFSKIAEQTITAVLGSGITWLFYTTKKNAKDLNMAFRKIRRIETDLTEAKDARPTSPDTREVP
jgi:hypothetical protein